MRELAAQPVEGGVPSAHHRGARPVDTVKIYAKELYVCCGMAPVRVSVRPAGGAVPRGKAWLGDESASRSSARDRVTDPSRGRSRMTHEIKPLELNLWFERVELLRDGGLGCVENSLRHAAHLSQLSPMAFRAVTNFALDEGNFEALLDTGDFDAAAQDLVQPEQLFLRVVAGGDVEAWISCPILGSVIRGTGGTIAAAVLDVWARRLLDFRAACGGHGSEGSESRGMAKPARVRGTISAPG